MNEIERQILDQLEALHSGIEKMRDGGEKVNFVGIFGEIDRLTGELPGGTDSQLLHYLHKKSYEKAHNFLLGRQSENEDGGCLRD